MTHDQDIHLRLATHNDLPWLAELAEKTFRQAFADDNDPDDLETYVTDAFSTPRLRAELDDANNTFFVAWDEEGDGLVGYAKLRRGTSASGGRGDRPIELERIYVDRSQLGAGVGALLMKQCLDTAIAERHDSIWLGVWERNERAIRFYERWGFEGVGHQVFQLGADAQTDLVMEKRLEPIGGESVSAAELAVR